MHLTISICMQSRPECGISRLAGREGYRTPNDAVMLTGFLHLGTELLLVCALPVSRWISQRGVTSEVQFKIRPSCMHESLCRSSCIDLDYQASLHAPPVGKPASDAASRETGPDKDTAHQSNRRVSGSAFQLP